jgi:hypothetical protein
MNGMSNLQFQGNVNIYLQGPDALEPMANRQNGHMAYYVASPESEITIYDFRHSSVKAAKRAIATFDDLDFADVFNQPAWAEIFESDECVKIVLSESQETSPRSLLWLGVLEEDEMTSYDIVWEAIRQVDNACFAFAVLIG